MQVLLIAALGVLVGAVSGSTSATPSDTTPESEVRNEGGKVINRALAYVRAR